MKTKQTKSVAVKSTFMRQVEMGSLTASIHLHDDGTHSFGFIQYSGGGRDRYFQMFFHLTGEDCDRLIGELQQVRAEARRREEMAKSDARMAADPFSRGAEVR